jgi:hypothetical protein
LCPLEYTNRLYKQYYKYIQGKLGYKAKPVKRKRRSVKNMKLKSELRKSAIQRAELAEDDDIMNPQDILGDRKKSNKVELMNSQEVEEIIEEEKEEKPV